MLVQNYLFKPPIAQGVMSTLFTVTTQSQMRILAAHSSWTVLCNEEQFSKPDVYKPNGSGDEHSSFDAYNGKP